VTKPQEFLAVRSVREEAAGNEGENGRELARCADDAGHRPAKAVGKAPNSVSYHLAMMEEHGFVTKVPTPEGRDSRETWYGLPEDGINISFDRETVDITPVAELLEKMQSFESAALDRHRKTALRGDLELRKRMYTASTSYYLTPDQEKDLREALGALAEKYYKLSEENEKDAEALEGLAQTYVRIEVLPIRRSPAVSREDR